MATRENHTHLTRKCTTKRLGQTMARANQQARTTTHQTLKHPLWPHPSSDTLLGTCCSKIPLPSHSNPLNAHQTSNAVRLRCYTTIGKTCPTIMQQQSRRQKEPPRTLRDTHYMGLCHRGEDEGETANSFHGRNRAAKGTAHYHNRGGRLKSGL